jgi:hypothetical protein
MPGAVKLYKSIDTIDSEDAKEIANYPAEFSTPLMSLAFLLMHYISKLVQSSSFSRTLTHARDSATEPGSSSKTLPTT